MSQLLLKEERVLTFKDIEGVPAEIQKIDSPELLPVCLKKDCTFEQVQKWLKKRGIPERREGLQEIKAEFGTTWMNDVTHASLSDQYWIQMRGTPWKRINFFTNQYSPDVGNMAFMPWTVTSKRISNHSPDLATGGILKKRWKQQADLSSRLIKAGSQSAHQYPLSEVLATTLAEELHIIPYVSYDLHIEGVTMCSICDNFVNQNLNFVPAHYIYYFEEKKDNETVLGHLLRMCEKFNIPDAEKFLHGMILIDHLTGNEDRNLGNIGFLQDVKTMKFVGPAPLFDCGNAYWNSQNVADSVKSKLFGSETEAILESMKKKCDFAELLRSDGYKKLISDYPCISSVKKEKLISAIQTRNRRIELGVRDFSR